MAKKLVLPEANWCVRVSGLKQAQELWDLLVKVGYKIGYNKPSVKTVMLEIQGKGYMNAVEYTTLFNSSLFTVKQVKSALAPPKPKKMKKWTNTVYFKCPSKEVAKAFHKLARSRGIDYPGQWKGDTYLDGDGYKIDFRDNIMYWSGTQPCENWIRQTGANKKVSVDEMFQYLSQMELEITFKGQKITKDEIEKLAKQVGLL